MNIAPQWPSLGTIKLRLREAIDNDKLTDAVYQVTCWRQFVSNTIRGIEMDVAPDLQIPEPPCDPPDIDHSIPQAGGPCVLCGEPITAYDSYGVGDGKAVGNRFHWECAKREARTVMPPQTPTEWEEMARQYCESADHWHRRAFELEEQLRTANTRIAELERSLKISRACDSALSKQFLESIPRDQANADAISEWKRLALANAEEAALWERRYNEQTITAAEVAKERDEAREGLAQPPPDVVPKAVAETLAWALQAADVALETDKGIADTRINIRSVLAKYQEAKP